MFVSCDDKSERDWTGYAVVVPCVSVGNVGQLAADLVISTLCMTKVGYLHDDSIVPVIGNDPFATGDTSKVCRLMTAAEVFVNDLHQLLVIQLRSSLVPGKKQEFLTNLDKWITSSHFSRVVILTSSFAHERRDTQLEGTQLRCIPSSQFVDSDAFKFIEETLKWRELEKRPVDPVVRDVDAGTGSEATEASEQNTLDVVEEKAAAECSSIFLPGGGFAKPLLQKCIACGVPAIVLLRFCSEGDNIHDAVELATMLNSWLSWLDLQKPSHKDSRHKGGWKIPSSWRLQFGSGFEQMLFQ